MTRINPLTAELIYLSPSTESAKPINRLTAVNGLNVFYKLTAKTCSVHSWQRYFFIWTEQLLPPNSFPLRTASPSEQLLPRCIWQKLSGLRVTPLTPFISIAMYTDLNVFTDVNGDCLSKTNKCQTRTSRQPFNRPPACCESIGTIGTGELSEPKLNRVE